MQAVKKSVRPVLLAIALATTSACVQPERPQTASDFCLNARRITIEPAPVEGMDDAGNLFDSDETVEQVLGHNHVMDRLCPQA